MSASVSNDKITQTMNGGNPIATTVSSNRSIGGTSLSVVGTTNWPTTTAVYFITYKKNTNDSMNTATLCSWKAVVSGTTLGSLTLENGIDAGNDAGDYVEMAPSAAWGEGIYEWAVTSHNTDGTLKDAVVSTAKVADGAITATKIANATITGANIADSTVGSRKIDFTTFNQYVELATSFSTTSTTLVQVPGLTLTVVVPAGGATYEVTLSSPSIYSSGNFYNTVNVFDGALGTTKIMEPTTYGSNGTSIPINYERWIPLDAGTHTLNVGFMVNGGTGNILSGPVNKTTFSTKRVL